MAECHAPNKERAPPSGSVLCAPAVCRVSAIILYTNSNFNMENCQQYKISYTEIFFKQDFIDVALKKDLAVEICKPEKILITPETLQVRRSRLIYRFGAAAFVTCDIISSIILLFLRTDLAHAAE